MPDYVCPECGDSAISRCVIVNGTLMHYNCWLDLKAKVRSASAARMDSFRLRHQRDAA